MEISDIIDLARQMGVILGLAFYVAIVIWTYKDARKRTEDPIMVATFTAISMLPLFGVFIYMLVRPAEYLADMRERELEIRALERQLGRQERCPYCKSHIEGDYLSCPVCTTKLRQSCVGCEKPLDPRWVMCPFCETEVPGRSGHGPAGPSHASRTARVGDDQPSAAPRKDRSEPRDRDRDRGREAGRTASTSASKVKSTKVASGATSSSAKKSSSSASSKGASKDVKGGDIRTEPFGAGDKRD